jgi:hypothetical protein
MSFPQVVYAPPLTIGGSVPSSLVAVNGTLAVVAYYFSDDVTNVPTLGYAYDSGLSGDTLFRTDAPDNVDGMAAVNCSVFLSTLSGGGLYLGLGMRSATTTLRVNDEWLIIGFGSADPALRLVNDTSSVTTIPATWGGGSPIMGGTVGWQQYHEYLFSFVPTSNTTFNVMVYDATANKWLNSSAAWVTSSTPLVCFAPTDAAAVTGAGYGWVTMTSTGGPAWIKEFAFVPAASAATAYTLSTPSPDSGVANTNTPAITLQPTHSGSPAPFFGAVQPASVLGAVVTTGEPHGSPITWAGTSTARTFTCTEPTAGIDTISATNSGGLTDPASVSYTVNPALAIEFAVDPSGEAIYAVVKGYLSGDPIPVSSLNSDLTLTIAGVGTVTLGHSAADAWWGATGTPYSPWVLWPLATPITAGQVLTVSGSADWLGTASGNALAMTGQSVTNLVGVARSNYPAIPATPRTMKTGWNTGDHPQYYNTYQKYANLAHNFCTYWVGESGSEVDINSDGYPTNIVGGFAEIPIIQTPASNGLGQATDLGFLCIPGSGTLTLLWTGPQFASDGSTPKVQLMFEATYVGGNPVTYVTSSAGTLTEVGGKWQQVYTYLTNQTVLWSPIVTVRVWGPDTGSPIISTLEVYPDGCDSSMIFNPTYLSSFAKTGAKWTRWMSEIDVDGFGQGGVVNFSDLTPDTALGWGTPTRGIGGTVTKLEPWTDTGRYFDNDHAIIKWTFSEPHGLSLGQLLVPDNPTGGPTSNGQFPTTNLVGGVNDYITLNNQNVPMVPIDDTTAYGGVFLNSIIAGTASAPASQPTITATYTTGLGTATNQLNSGPPRSTQIAFANQTRTNLWVNIPGLLTTSACTSLGTLYGENLWDGAQIILEFGNETWNGIMGTTYYSSMKANSLGLTIDTVHPYLANIARNAFLEGWTGANRNASDVKLSLGGWYITPSRTYNMAAYAAANDIAFDAVHIASYWGNLPAAQLGPQTGGGETSFTTIAENLTSNQTFCMLELNVMYGGYTDIIDEHYAQLASAGYTDKPIHLYESGVGGFEANNSATPTATRNSFQWNCQLMLSPRSIDSKLYFNWINQEHGIDLMVDFAWGAANENVLFNEQWTIFYSYNMVPGVGDGSDGRFDNTSNFEDYNHIVAPYAHAVGQWNTPGGSGSGLAGFDWFGLLGD